MRRTAAAFLTLLATVAVGCSSGAGDSTVSPPSPPPAPPPAPPPPPNPPPPPPAPGPITSVTVTGLTSVTIDRTNQLGTTAKDANNNTIPGHAVTWSTSNALVATVSSSGLVTGVAIGGPISIFAMIDGIQGSIPMTVIPVTFSTGEHVVSAADVPAGRYRSNNSQSASCYWERLSGFGGTLGEIIANNIGSGPAVVDVGASDKGFNSTGCSNWSGVVGPITSSRTTPFTQGDFIIGTDIAPGTWQAAAGSSSCYWARLRDFGGVVSTGVIANYIGPTPQIVVISPSDAGFETQGCGAWTKIG